FFSTVVLPVVLATISYYLLRPILRWLERLRIPRVYGILILFLGTAGLFTLLIFLLLPFLRELSANLVEEFPTYFKQLIVNMYSFFRSSIFALFYESSNINVNTFLDSGLDNIGKFFTETLGGIASGVTTFIS